MESEQPQAALPTIEAPAPSASPVNIRDDIEANRDLAAFSYLYVISIIIFFLKGKHSPFIRFHAKQAMVLCALAIVFLFVPVLHTPLEIGIFCVMAYGFLEAAQGKSTEILFVGPVSQGNIRKGITQLVDAVVELKKKWDMHRQKKPVTASPSPSAPPPASHPTPPAGGLGGDSPDHYAQTHEV